MRALRLVVASSLMCALLLVMTLPAALAQAEPAPVDLTLLTTQVTWQAPPLVQVNAQLWGPTGRKGQATAYANTEGQLTLQFRSPGQPGDPRATVIEPGDRLELRPLSGSPLTVTLPMLAADLDSVGGRIVGRAPAGAALQLKLFSPDDLLLTEVTIQATAEGVVSWALPAGLPWTPGSWGELLLSMAGGHRIRAQFREPSMEIDLTRRQASGNASLGTDVVIATSRSGQRPATSDLRRVLNRHDGQWSLLRIAMPPGEARMSGLDLSLELRRTDLALSRAMTLTLPLLEVSVDWPAANRVRGQAPPDAAIELRLIQGGAVKERVSLLADGAGRWSWDPGGAARYGPGWRAEVVYSLRPGTIALAGAETQGLRVALNGSAVEGVVAAGSSFTVTLRSASNDTVKDRRRIDLAPGEGSFNINLGDNEILSETRILPGDALWLERATGDPLVVPVPAFALGIDLAGKRVLGRTLPGYGIRLSGSSGVMDLITDDRGDFQTDLASLGGPAPRCQTYGCQGRAELTVPGGHRFVAAWGVPDLTIDLTDSIVSGHSAGGQSVALDIHDKAGRRLGGSGPTVTGDNGLIPSVGYWIQRLRDPAGRVALAHTGDLLMARLPHSVTLALPIPLLEGRVVFGRNEVQGRARPGSKGRLQLHRSTLLSGTGTELPWQADANGSISVVLAPSWNLRYRDNVGMVLEEDGLRWERTLPAPGLVLRLPSGRLEGAAEPAAAVDLVWSRASKSLGRQRVSAEASGEFSIRLRDGQGRAWPLRKGDQLQVLATGAGAVESQSLTVPEFTVQLDPVARLLTGRVSEGGLVRISLLPNLGPLEALVRPSSSDSQVIEMPGGGDFSVATEAGRFPPRLLIQGQFELGSGHMVLLDQQRPGLAYAQEGATVCAFGPADAPVRLRLVGADNGRLAAAQDTVGEDGFARLTLRDEAGRAMAIHTGQRLMAEIGPDSVQEGVGTFTVSMDWAARTVSGEGPPGAPAALRLQAAACGDWVPHSRMTILDPVGRYELGPMDLAPRGLAHPYQVTLLTSSGQRAYREWVRTRVIVHLDRPKLSAETTALTTLSIQTPGFESASAEADELGRWSLALRDDQRQPHQPKAGEALQLVGPDERMNVMVEPLDFDLDPQTGILGQSLPGRRIAIALRLVNGQFARFSTTADAEGRFSFGSADLPTGLEFNQVSRVSLEAQTPDGHAMRRDWNRFSTIALVYLPVIVSPPGP